MADLLLSVIEIVNFLIGTALLALPVAVIVFLANVLRKKLAQKFKLSWIKSVFLSSFIAMLVLTTIIYSFPALTVSVSPYTDNLPPTITTELVEQNGDLVEIPATMDESVFDYIAFYSVTAIRLIIVAFVLTALLLPLQIIGSFVFERIQKKNKNYWIAFYIACFSGTLVFAIVMLFFPWLLSSLFYYIFLS